jgi:hypothetical protein
MRVSILDRCWPSVIVALQLLLLQSWCRAADPSDAVSETIIEFSDEFWDGFRADHPICCPWLDLLPSEKEKLWGFVDRKGALVIKRQFDHVDHFREGLSVVWKRKKYGFIDRSGKIAIPIEFDGAFSFSEGLAGVTKKGKGAYIDRSGNVVLQFEDGIFLTEFREDCAIVAKLLPDRRPEEPKFGIVNKRGQYIVKPGYQTALPMSNGRAWLMKDLRWFCVDCQGKMIGEVPYLLVRPFREGLAAVVSDDKWAFIGTDLKIVIPPQFHETHDFSEGLAPVALDGKWGFIDLRGTMVIKPAYDMVAPADLKGAYVRDGKAIVLKDGWWLEIDSSGRELAKLGKSTVPRAK